MSTTPSGNLTVNSGGKVGDTAAMASRPGALTANVQGCVNGAGIADTTFTTLGLRASGRFMLGSVQATAHGMLGWRHAFGDTAPVSLHAFDDGDAFSVAGVPIAEDAAIIEAGLDLDISDRASLGIAYFGQFASHAHANGFNANLTVRF